MARARARRPTATAELYHNVESGAISPLSFFSSESIIIVTTLPPTISNQRNTRRWARLLLIYLPSSGHPIRLNPRRKWHVA